MAATQSRPGTRRSHTRHSRDIHWRRFFFCREIRRSRSTWPLSECNELTFIRQMTGCGQVPGNERNVPGEPRLDSFRSAALMVADNGVGFKADVGWINGRSLGTEASANAGRNNWAPRSKWTPSAGMQCAAGVRGGGLIQARTLTPRTRPPARRASFISRTLLRSGRPSFEFCRPASRTGP